jgi:hypothetical protein
MDNSNMEMEEEFGFRFNWDNPGATDPIDMCKSCAATFENTDANVVHPPYEEQEPPYTCRACWRDLTEDDNGNT